MNEQLSKVHQAKIDHSNFLRSKGTRYIRKGQCNHCGWCCSHENPPCIHLEWHDGKSFCSVHGTDKQPLYCKRFPELPPIKNERCGYYFIDTWNNNKRLKTHEV